MKFEEIEIETEGGKVRFTTEILGPVASPEELAKRKEALIAFAARVSPQCPCGRGPIGVLHSCSGEPPKSTDSGYAVDPNFERRLREAAARIMPMTPEVAAAFASGPEVSGGELSSALRNIIHAWDSDGDITKACEAARMLVPGEDPHRLAYEAYAHQMGKEFGMSEDWGDLFEDERNAWRAGFEEIERLTIEKCAKIVESMTGHDQTTRAIISDAASHIRAQL